MSSKIHMNGLISNPKPHFILIPLMAQGHVIPMVDMAHLLADRGATVSFITTPVNAARLRSVIERANSSGLPIHFVELDFPCAELGLPDGCENLDLVAHPEHSKLFYYALELLRKPLESYLRGLELGAACVISDGFHYWTMEVAREFKLPRLIFHGPSCFYVLSSHNIRKHKVHEGATDMAETFVVPDLPRRIELTRENATGNFLALPGWEELLAKIETAEATADGAVVNTFLELEADYINLYQKAIGKTVLPIGPLSLYHKDNASKSSRGNKAVIDERSLLSFLDAMEPKSVIYVSFGSLVPESPSQLIEIGCALEASERPFVWVLREAETYPQLKDWMSEGFLERTRGRSLIITGWAPQVLILSHPSIGGFMTHCGWNSVLEAVSAGVPMITWPHVVDQFLNEKLVVEVLRIGVSVGNKEISFYLGNDVVCVKREKLEEAVLTLMDGGEEGEERRERARVYGEKARKAMEDGGSSYENLNLLIKYVLDEPRM